MAFLSSETLRQRLPEILGAKYDESNIRYGAYELHLGPEIFVTTCKVKTRLAEDDQFEIPSGQLALLLTEETLTMPKDLIAFISVKFGEKFRGLINISGFHVDPGFKGRLKFSVYNAGSQPVILSRGKSTFQIWFSSLDKEEYRPYDGKHKNQDMISDEDVMQLRGDIASPAVLHAEIEKLRSDVNTHLRVLDNKFAANLAIGLIIAGVVFKALIFDPIVATKNPASPETYFVRPQTRGLEPNDNRGIPKQNNAEINDSASSKGAQARSKSIERETNNSKEKSPTKN